MQKRIRVLVFIFMILLLGYGTYLITYLRINDSIPKVPFQPDVRIKDLPAGELAVDKSKPIGETPFKEITLNNIWVKGSNKYVSEADGTLLVDVELGFLHNGLEKYFTITLAGVVNLAEFSRNGDNYMDIKGVVPADSFDLIEGEYATVVIDYFSVEDFAGKNVMNSFCKINTYPVCQFYLKLGFGENPVSEELLLRATSGDLDKLPPSQFAVRSYIRNFAIPKVQ